MRVSTSSAPSSIVSSPSSPKSSADSTSRAFISSSNGSSTPFSSINYDSSSATYSALSSTRGSTTLADVPRSELPTEDIVIDVGTDFLFVPGPPWGVWDDRVLLLLVVLVFFLVLFFFLDDAIKLYEVSLRSLVRFLSRLFVLRARFCLCASKHVLVCVSVYVRGQV